MDSFASWKMNGRRMEKEEREETPLQGEDESRRSSPPLEAMDKTKRRKKERNQEWEMRWKTLHDRILVFNCIYFLDEN